MRAVLGAQQTEDTCREGESPGLPDSLDPGDTVAHPLLDARVSSVQRNSAGDRHWEFRNAVSELVQSLWAGWPVSGPRTFLWCCKFMSEHALHRFGTSFKIRANQWFTPVGPCCARTRVALSRDRAWVHLWSASGCGALTFCAAGKTVTDA